MGGTGVPVLNGLREAATRVETREDGVLFLRHPDRLEERHKTAPAVLLDTVRSQPDAVFLRERDRNGKWSSFTYAEILALSDALASGIQAQGVASGDVVAIFAENSVAHAVLGLALAALGAISAPLAPLLLDRAPDQARELCEQLAVRAVATDRNGPFKAGQAIDIDLSEGLDGLRAISRDGNRPETSWAARVASLDLRSIAKILFTSGSTGTPKPVVNTHAMISAAQDMQSQLFDAVVATSDDDEHYEITDWLPWHHTFGGNSNFYGVLWAGGTLTIDAGRPVEGGFQPTLDALAANPPTAFVGVPASIAMLVDHLEADDELARRFFRRVRLLTSGGAALSPALVSRLQALAVAHVRQPLLVGGGYGMTETCAMITQIWWPDADPATLGLPPPGITLKLVPAGEGRYECRVRGPNVTPGYFHAGRIDPAGMFDEDGFFRTGDALGFVESGQPERGLTFAGRLTEEFKLGNGTWVRAGALRGELVEALSGLVRDVVIVGENRNDAGALLWMIPGARREELAERIAAFNAGRSISRRIKHLAPLSSEPDADSGEITPKGSLNQIRMRQTRSAEIDALYVHSAWTSEASS